MCYEDLANAIVTKAAYDYRAACKRYKKGDDREILKIKKIERFFNSEWGDLLCKGNAKEIFRRLQAEQESDATKRRPTKFSLKR